MRRIYLSLVILISIIFILLSIFTFTSSFSRIIECFKDLGLSIAYWFCYLFGIENNIVPTVNNLPQQLFTFIPVETTILPNTFEGFQDKWNNYWEIFITSDNLKSYLLFISNIIFEISKIIIIMMPIIFILYMLFNHILSKQNNDYNKDTKYLIKYKSFVEHIYKPVKRFILNFINYIRQHKCLYVFWLILWLYNFNIITIIIEFISYYFYFTISFDFVSIYKQVYKLFLDLNNMFEFVPIWCYVIIGFLIFDHIRKKIAYARLNHFERKNRGFINARPIVYMVCGTMGKKKTTAITDMALSQEIMFRDKAFELILVNDLKFPYFPWINLENELKRAIEHHEVYNLATVRSYIAKKHLRFNKDPKIEKIFNYDYEKYGSTYDDKLRIVDIWEVLENYSQLYFIYIIESSLLISNYSVRVDSILSDLGNFPLWNNDFFKTDSRLIDSYSRHSHILDFDSLRLGKKVVEHNINSNNFEFGVVIITEVGKERSNNLGLQEMKKNSDTTNQKNDLFNSWLKMVRHSATVDNFPFVKVITDEQRPESWGADARDLCEIVHINETSDTYLTMPFFSLMELIYSFVISKFQCLYYRYRYIRSDNTLTMYLLKNITARINHYYKNIYNRFGYCVLQVEVESGTQDGQLQHNKYYIMSKKIYSKRFSTDCFSDFFTYKALRSPVGINDLSEYDTEKARLDELKQQNSYFINDLVNGFYNNHQNN